MIYVKSERVDRPTEISSARPSPPSERVRTLKHLGVVLAGFMMLGAISTACDAVTTTSAPAPAASVSDAPVESLRPCEAEDSAGPCFWDADTRGNGEGRSFIVSAGGLVTYLDAAPEWEDK